MNPPQTATLEKPAAPATSIPGGDQSLGKPSTELKPSTSLTPRILTSSAMATTRSLIGSSMRPQQSGPITGKIGTGGGMEGKIADQIIDQIKGLNPMWGKTFEKYSRLYIGLKFRELRCTLQNYYAEVESCRADMNWLQMFMNDIAKNEGTDIEAFYQVDFGMYYSLIEAEEHKDLTIPTDIIPGAESPAGEQHQLPGAVVHSDAPATTKPGEHQNHGQPVTAGSGAQPQRK